MVPVFVRTKLESGVGRITLSRPDKRNALTRDFIQQISDAVADLKEIDALRVLIFEAEGSVFCAGMDLQEMRDAAKSPTGSEDLLRDSQIYAQLLSEIYRLSVPTIAVMQGPALAGGVGLVLACDFIIATDGAFLMLPEPARGITAAIVTPLLIYRIGNGPAIHVLLSGEKISAARATQLGLYFDVVDPESLAARANSLSQSIMTGSKSALKLTKSHAQRCASGGIADQLQLAIEVSAKARESDDAKEGLAAFLEKRKPNWQS